jgi:hypothetical protein
VDEHTISPAGDPFHAAPHDQDEPPPRLQLGMGEHGSGARGRDARRGFVPLSPLRRGEDMNKLQRTTFETSRAAEYFDARQLSAPVGVAQDEFASVCLKELVDNSLDACETAGVSPVVGVKV